MTVEAAVAAAPEAAAAPVVAAAKNAMSDTSKHIVAVCIASRYEITISEEKSSTGRVRKAEEFATTPGANGTPQPDCIRFQNLAFACFAFTQARRLC